MGKNVGKICFKERKTEKERTQNEAEKIDE